MTGPELKGALTHNAALPQNTTVVIKHSRFVIRVSIQQRIPVEVVGVAEFMRELSICPKIYTDFIFDMI